MENKQDTKPSRLATQDPQEVNAQGHKPSDHQRGASPEQNLVHGEGGEQMGTTGAIHTPSGNTIPDASNPHATLPGTTQHTTENASYAHGQSHPDSQHAVEQTRTEPPPGRKPS